MKNKIQKKIPVIASAVIVFLALCINYICTSDADYQADSESLAVGSMIYAENNDDFPDYGLLSIQSYDGDGAKVRSMMIEGEELGNIQLSGYKSQLGLQGYVFIVLYRILRSSASAGKLLFVFRDLCAVLLSAVFTVLVFLLAKKYNRRFAAAFFAVFFLSPWIRNFASNLFWVAFTWFVPMLLGLILSMDYKKYDRLFMYILITLSVAFKCACGYEYMSTMMMGLIMFSLGDLFACRKEDRKHIFFVIVKMGISALLGFALVIYIHALVRGDGSIGEGLASIWDKTVVRRTFGGDPSLYPEVLKDSFEATVAEVLKKYFSFSTQIIEGIPGEMFVPLIILALVIYIVRALRHSGEKQELPLMAFSFIATASWFILAKSHSYIHTHMNFVLWYFGFVQMCIYALFTLLPSGEKEKK